MAGFSRNAPLVTGLGAVCALGAGVPGIWSSLCEGRSGLRAITGFSRDGLRSEIAGWIETEPNPSASSRIELFAVQALQEALADGRVSAFEGGRTALVFGTSLGMSLVDPGLAPAPLQAMAGDDKNADLHVLAQRLRAQFPVFSEVRVVSTACSSGTHAIGLAADMVEHEGYDVVVAGGADVIDRLKYLGHSALSTLSTGVPRPYSTQRDGTLFGEGAAFVVLQPDAPALRTRAYARCSGAGYSTDVSHLTAPDETGEGAAVAVRTALQEAGVAPEAIDHVNLHGSGTALNDSAEFAALQSVFGARIARIPSTSIKAAIGHLMGAAGAIEAIATILSLHDGRVPPTAHTRAEDVGFDIDLVTGQARALARAGHALTLSLGFGGANGALVFSAPAHA